MSASTKLSTAVKALCCLAENPGTPMNSIKLSEQTGVNASKLRKLLSMLANSGIVKSVKGMSGGFMLGKSVGQIHLQEIYCSIEDRKAFHLDVHKFEGHHLSQPVQINNYFLDLFGEIQVEIENKMEQISLQSIMNKLES
jgi:Rrf2 family protein